MLPSLESSGLRHTRQLGHNFSIYTHLNKSCRSVKNTTPIRIISTSIQNREVNKLSLLVVKELVVKEKVIILQVHDTVLPQTIQHSTDQTLMRYCRSAGRFKCVNITIENECANGASPLYDSGSNFDESLPECRMQRAQAKNSIVSRPSR